MLKPAVFLDRDGVINEDIGYLHRIDDFRFSHGALAAARQLHEMGYALVVVTNQSGIARGFYTDADFQQLTAWMNEQFRSAGAPLTAVYHCPHHAEQNNGESCECRKPLPGMLLKAAADHQLDLSRSLMVGDKEDDVRAGCNAGVYLTVRIGPAGTETGADACLISLADVPAWLQSRLL
ncbi:MAG: D-glycero-beta-D-manno-heptose 1,7-bisphosphate 7-phosphatase [Gammaproteobacteria bacterium]|nr:D-glycero-beta-D-manno-heptose 1,7-bisphosphate 7-phosphatase [Gammaproteobacteria bacterium]